MKSNIIKILTLLIISFVFMFNVVDAQAAHQYKDPDLVWDILKSLDVSDEVAAGIMGYYYRESGFKTDALVGWYLHPQSNINRKFVREVNKGLSEGSSREYFITTAHNAGGFGIGQWYAEKELGELYDYMQENNHLIDNLKGQCEYTVKSIKENQKLQSYLKDAKTADECAKWIAIYYDGASDIGIAVIRELAVEFYDEYAGVN